MKKFFLIFIIWGSVGCEAVPSSNAEECYYVAEHKYKGSLGDISQSLLETHLSISDAHYSGELLHVPLMLNRSIYFGGLCSETVDWIHKLKESYEIKKISEGEYDKVYAESK